MMALFKVRALYDFSGEPNSAELSITAGEVLTVTRTDVGEGWWEGKNNVGASGLFPETYVERVEEAVQPSRPPSIPAPVLRSQNTWEDSPQDVGETDDWDDEFDNDDTYSEIGNSNQREAYYSNEPNQNYGDNMSESNFSVDNRGTVTKKSLNIFSTYVKSGLESYILGTLKDAAQNVQKVEIYLESENVPRWKVIVEPYTVQVTSPKKATKMGGLKSFIAYQLTPSFSNIEVSRRYKHFDWLHNRLSEKFNVLAIPPLPDKQISGRYEEQFIEHRRVQLQEFVNYVCRHPVLSACDVWHHFLSCTNEKQWKEGKRKAERDQLIGANFCLCVEAPERELLQSNVDSKIESSVGYITQVDHCIKNLMQTATDQQKKSENLYKREQMKIGECFFQLGVAFERQGENALFSSLATDVKKIGTTYVEIAKLYDDQAKMDWQPLSDKLYLYRGITSSYPYIFSMQKHAEQKKKECEKNVQMTHLNEVRRRTDILTYAVFAELDHFQNEMNTEFKAAMKLFLEEQVNFYKNIVRKFEDTLGNFQ